MFSEKKKTTKKTISEPQLWKQELFKRGAFDSPTSAELTHKLNRDFPIPSPLFVDQNTNIFHIKQAECKFISNKIEGSKGAGFGLQNEQLIAENIYSPKYEWKTETEYQLTAAFPTFLCNMMFPPQL